ncbi:MAG: TonB-dependent receptor [Saprospiraceae bacterium]|nr:TonB-dependent receptor [Saprospiraceae bacterium]
MKRQIHLSLLFVLFAHFLHAQERFSVSGAVKDAKTGEELIGASVRLKDKPTVGTLTNEYGFYSLTLEKGTYTLLFDFIGYNQVEKTVVLDKNQKFDVSIGETAKQLSEVVISAKKADENIRTAQMGVEKIDVKDVAKIPVLFGEKDILKTIQLLPGVKSAGEGQSGFYVRGGAVDQNLILLDEAPVYNANHLLGFFSTFNSDAIKDATLVKGNAPPQYGGRLSSVLDIKMNEGNNQDFGASGGIGLISSKLNLEGPIQKDKSSFLLTGRRTYADAFLKLSNDSTLNNNTLYFYDLNAKVNYKLSSKDRLFLSGYFGRDKLGFGDVFGIDWGNATGTARWNHVWNDRLFSNTSLIYSNYDYKIKISQNSTNFNITSQIEDWNLKQEFQFFSNPNNSWRFGFNVIHHDIVPGNITNESTDGSGPTFGDLQKRQSLESAIYAGNNQKIGDKLELNYGLRLSVFNVLGGSNYYNIDTKGNITDTLDYAKGSIVKTYINLEPRLSLAYTLTPSVSLKAAYARNTQNMHLLTNSTTTSPTDRWVSSSNIIKPEIADQFSIGYFQNFADNKYELSLEAYYKTMQNQVDYRDGANLRVNDAVETELLFGKGRAYGLELLLKKKSGKFNGWISYTLARSERQLDGVNGGSWYPARQDRMHDIAVVGIYQLNPKWTLGATWVYYTGNAVTFPSGKYNVADQILWYYTERNGYRMPAYHRMDLSATWQLKKGKRWESELAFSIYNVYGRENAYSINFRQSETDPTKTEVVQTALFKQVPSISYNFKF